MSPKMVRLVACALATTALAATGIPQASMAAGPAATAYKAPRNGFGQPDLTGTWSNTTLTRFERASELGNRAVLTPQEIAAIEGARAKLLKDGAKPTDPNATTQEVNKSCDLPGFPATADCAYNVGWTDAGSQVMRVNGQPRTSLITFPANGRIPYLPGKERRFSMGEGVADNPEDRNLPERCLVSQNISTGALMNPTLYNNTYVFAQNRDTVAIIVEMAHDARIVKLNAKHDPMPRWFGDSIGHWEGDTLVVETTNFHPQQLKAGRNSAQLKLTEKFTRVANDRLLYQFKVEDPETYSQPWGGEYEFSSSKQPQYEYACHEGNYGLLGILQGARAQEKERQAKLSER